MKHPKGAGALRERVTFMRLDEIPDDYGGVTTGYVDVFPDAARLQPKLGSETVMAGRLQGVQPYLLTVRSSSSTRQVTPAWRVRNDRSGRTYNIKTVVNPDERNAMLEMLVVEGEAG